MAIDFQHLQGGLCGALVDLPAAAHLGVIAHAAKKPVGDARRTTRAAGNFDGTLIVDRHSQDLRGSLHDDLQILVRVKLQPQHDAET